MGGSIGKWGVLYGTVQNEWVFAGAFIRKNAISFPSSGGGGSATISNCGVYYIVGTWYRGVTSGISFSHAGPGHYELQDLKLYLVT